MRPERQLRLKQITCISTTWVNEYGDFTTVIPVNVARRGGFPFWRNVGRDQKSRAAPHLIPSNGSAAHIFPQIIIKTKRVTRILNMNGFSQKVWRFR